MLRNTFTVAILILGPMTASAFVPDRPAPDADALGSLQGTWSLIEMESDGRPHKERNYRWVITADVITIMIDNQDRGSWSYRVTLPAAIDLTPRGHFKPPTYPSLFRLKGGRLVVCLQNFPNRGRPKDFATLPDSGIGKFTFERIQ